MTESQFYKATHDGVCGFEIITYKTEERTSDVGAIPGVYEKVITCLIEGVIADKGVCRIRIGNMLAAGRKTADNEGDPNKQYNPFHIQKHYL